jgi:NNP family nitrate/nitrite transporter-like MFS transporter
MTAGTGTTALLPGIAVAYTVAAGSCGTAGGVVATLQLLGAVIIPTYVVGPIAGANISVFFTAAGVCMIFCFVFGFCLPELGRKKQAS